MIPLKIKLFLYKRMSMWYNLIMRLFNNKRCPRCNSKMPNEMVICPGCQLNFNKFDSATNAEAKVAMRKGDKDNVLLRTGCPSDISRIKLILLTVFLGFTGAHYYYVGRNKMGLFFSIFCGVGLINSIITTLLDATPSGELYQIFTLCVLMWGFVILIWLVDIAKVCLNKFKIPVSRTS